MKYNAIPKGIWLLLSYCVLVLMLIGSALLSINYGNDLLIQIIRSLLIVSIIVGVMFMLIFIISVLYVANRPKNTKHGSEEYFNKKSKVSYRYALANCFRGIAYGLTDME